MGAFVAFWCQKNKEFDPSLSHFMLMFIGIGLHYDYTHGEKNLFSFLRFLKWIPGETAADS
jgi:hypothetical protein